MLRTFFLLISLFFSLSPCLSQEGEEEQSIKPNIIEVDQVIAEIEKSQLLLQAIQNDQKAFDKDAIQNKQGQLKKELDEHKTEFEALFLQPERLRSLDDLVRLEQGLVTYQAKLDTFKERLNARVEKLTKYRIDLSSIRHRWKKSARTLIQDTSSLTRTQIRELQKQIDSSLNSIEKAVKDLLTLQTTTATLTQDLSSLLEQLAKEKSSFRSSLLTRDDAPIYSAVFWESLLSLPFGELLHVYEDEKESIGKYLQAHHHLFTFHILLFCLFSWLIYRAKDYEFIQQSFPKLYDNPFLLSVTVALLLSFPLYSDAGEAFANVIGMLCVFPLILVFRDLLDKQYTVILGGIGLLYVCDQDRSLLKDFSEISMLILLAELVLAFFLARYFVRECDKQTQELEKPSLALWFAQQGGIVSSYLFLASALLLLGGYSRLITYLSDNLFFAVYSALLLFVAHHLIVGFLTALLHVRFIDVLRSIAKHRLLISHAIDKWTGVLFSFFWISSVVVHLGVREEVRTAFLDVLRSGIKTEGVQITVQGVLLALLFLYVGYKFSQLVRFILAEDVYDRRQVSTALRSTIDTGIHYLLMGLCLLAALASLGVGFGNIALIAGALSVGIGFGLQNIVNNFVSGIILLVERPIKVGDLILIGSTLGNVTRIGIRSSTIRTLDEAEIIIPNGTLVTESVINWTLSSARARISVFVGVAYGSDVPKVMELLKDTLQELPFVLDYPAVSVLFKEFGDSSLNFEARGWVRNVQKRPKYESEMMVAVSSALKENGIEIPFPQRDVHIIPSVANGGS